METLPPEPRDPVRNPFTPGYGALPTVFAGRETEFRDLEVMARRVSGGIYEQSRHVVGVRGIGKTALLAEYAQWAGEQGLLVVRLSIAPGMNLLAALAHRLGAALSAHAPIGERIAERAFEVLRLLAGFALRYGSQEWHLEYRGRPVPAATGELSGDAGTDLRDLLVRASEAAAQTDGAVMLLLDEVQSAPRAELGPLLYALQDAQGSVTVHHDPMSGRELRRSAHLGVVLAGLPSLPTAMREAAATFMSRSKAVRLEPLSDAATREALPSFTQPLGVGWEPDAVDLLVEVAAGYPYFLHVYGSHAWNAGVGDRITADHVRRGMQTARAMVAAFYDERLEPLSDLQRRTLRAIATLDEDHRRTGAIAEAMGYRQAAAVSSTLDRLLGHGLIGRSGRGHYELLIPGLDRHLRDQR